VKCAACGSLNIQDAKDRHFGTIAQLCRAETVSLQRRDVSTIGKKLLNIDTSSICPHNTRMVNFSLLTAEICWRVWDIPAKFNGFRVLAALLHGTLVVGISHTLRHWTEGATYIRQGGHHVGPHSSFLFFLADWGKRCHYMPLYFFASNFAKCSPIFKLFFTGRLSSNF